MPDEYTIAHDVPSDKSYTTLFLTMLVGFLVLSSFLIFSRQSLRLDEAQSLWQTSHSPFKMISIVAEDVHVPLYHLLLHLWELLLGNGVVTTRVLSLIFASLSIPAMYFLGKVSYNRYVGMFGALILTISPFFNWYGNEIRMYSLLVFLTILNQYFFIKIFKSKSYEPQARLWWGYGVTVILGMLTHYFFGLTLLSQAIFFFLSKKEFPAHAFRRFVGVAFISALLFAPWAYFVIRTGGPTNSTPLLYKPTTIDLFNTFSQFIFGFQDDHINTILVSLWPLTVLLVFLTLRKKRYVYSQTTYFLLSAFVPILVAFLVSITFRPVFVTRYLILTIPSLYLLISWVFSTYPFAISRLTKTALVLIMLVMLSTEAVSAATPVKENYRDVTAFLELNAKPQDIIVVSAPFTIYPLEYYYRGPATIETLPIWNRYITGPIPPFSEEKLPEEVETLKANHQMLWLVLSFDQGYEEKIRLYMDAHYERVEAKNFSPHLNVYGYKLRYDTEYIESTTVMKAST